MFRRCLNQYHGSRDKWQNQFSGMFSCMRFSRRAQYTSNPPQLPNQCYTSDIVWGTQCAAILRYPRMSCRMWSTVLWHTPTSAANSCTAHWRSTCSKEARSWIVWLSIWGRPEWHPSLHGTISPIVPLCDMAKHHHHTFLAVPDNSFVHYDLVQLQFLSRSVVLL